MMDTQNTHNMKKIGWFCGYTPVELFIAAGLTPHRILGTQASRTLASARLCNNLCPYVLSCLGVGLQNNDKSLTGVVVTNSCDAMRRLYDAWQHYVKTPFVYLLDLPKIATKQSKEYFQKCLSGLVQALESHYKVKISEKELKESIKVCNETRRLLSQLYILRKEGQLPLHSQQVLNIVKSSMSGCRKSFNQQLSSLLAECKSGKPIPPKEPVAGSKEHRILISGGYVDETGLIDIVEKYGGKVVCEDLCTGIRSFRELVDIEGDPLAALSEYYLEKAPCSRMIDSDRRLEYLEEIIEEYKIEGVIYYTLKYCDTNSFEFPYLRRKLKEKKIPLLFLESDGTLSESDSGQMHTRVQAFLEML